MDRLKRAHQSSPSFARMDRLKPAPPKQSELRSDGQAEACPTKTVRVALGWTGRRPFLLGGRQREIDSQFPVQALGEWAIDQGHRRLIVDVAGGEVVQRVAVDNIHN